jgi:LacI family transcriptional regulator
MMLSPYVADEDRGGLSVVARPVEQLAQAAVAALLQQIDEPDQPIHNVVLPTELVIRKSVVDLRV